MAKRSTLPLTSAQIIVRMDIINNDVLTIIKSEKKEHLDNIFKIGDKEYTKSMLIFEDMI